MEKRTNKQTAKQKVKEYFNKIDNSTSNLALEKLATTRADNATEVECFVFSNENLTDLAKVVPFKNKRVLTVGSSGDQALMAIYHGAKEVVLADGNELTQPFVELKIAAIKNMSYGEFMYYMVHAEQVIPNHKIYAQLSQHLSAEARNFWDTIFLETDPEVSVEKIVDYSQGRRILHYQTELYDSPKTFEKLKRRLNGAKLSYVYADVSQFVEKTKGQFDTILLSNISECVSEKDRDKFYHTVEKLYNKRLAPNGVIQADLNMSLTSSVSGYSNALSIGRSFWNKRNLANAYENAGVKDLLKNAKTKVVMEREFQNTYNREHFEGLEEDGSRMCYTYNIIQKPKKQNDGRER